MDIYCTLLYIFNSSTYLQQSLQLSNSLHRLQFTHATLLYSLYSASFCADCTCTVAYRRCRKRVERGVSHQSNQRRMQMITLATFDCLCGPCHMPRLGTDTDTGRATYTYIYNIFPAKYLPGLFHWHCVLFQYYLQAGARLRQLRQINNKKRRRP